MQSQEIRARKRALREAARVPMAGPEPRAARAAQDRLVSLVELEEASSVSLYAATEHEVPVGAAAAVLRGRGIRLAFPRVEGVELTLHEVDCLETLKPGYRGILEPAADAVGIPPEDIDLFVVPGLLFDRGGGRLGRGGGHFDRLLARARADARRVGFCYADRVVPELPVEDGDICMHAIVTQLEVIRPGPALAGPGARGVR